jgi:hypothetical protein
VSHHSQASIAARHQVWLSRQRERDPDVVHDFLPSRKIDDDTCSVCHKAWENAVHIPIGPEDPGEA